MDSIFKRDYKIEIKFDINGTPYWHLYRKDVGIVANDEQGKMVSETFEQLKQKFDKH